MKKVSRFISLSFVLFFCCAVFAEGNTGFVLKDGLVPVVFTAGSDTDVYSHASASGYSCEQVIAAGHSDGIISDGRIVLLPCDSEQYYLYFDCDGNAGNLFSNIQIDFTVNNITYKNAFYGVNTSASDTRKLVYTDISHTHKGELPENSITVNFKSSGKLLAGGILTGEVSAGNGDFSLSASENSQYGAILSDLKIGDKVTLFAHESLYDAKDITERGISAFTPLGQLVENGENLTRTFATIGGYNVRTYKSYWSALCVLPDGSVMFYTTSIQSNLSDMAKELTELSCEQAYLLWENARLGGEKTATGLVVGAVNRAELEASRQTESTLETLMNAAEAQLSVQPMPAVTEWLESANAVCLNANATENMLLRVISLFERTSITLPKEYASGDINGDGKINSTDVVQLKYIVLGIDNTVTAAEKARADVDRNGALNTLDYIRLRYHILGISLLED